MNQYFTLEEANRLLPKLKQEVEALQRLKLRYDETFAYLHELKYEAADEEVIIRKEFELEFLQIEARTHIRNIHRQGVWLKSVELGLLDFPAILNGEEVLLCWKLGEESILFYHSMKDGFMGRKPIDDDLEFENGV